MRSREWGKIWNKRSVILKEEDLYSIDGFNMLTCYQWNTIVRFFCNKLCINGNERFLEVGCGCGAFLSEIKKEYNDICISGFDISENIIKIANQKVDGEFFVKDASDKEWNIDKSFDIIISFSVFHYFDNLISSENSMENILDLLAEDGKIMIGDIPDKFYEEKDKEIRKQGKRNRDGKANHLYYSKDFFIDFSKKHNMKIEIIDHRYHIKDFFPNKDFRYTVILKKEHK